jgi:hypothetical protein
MYMESNNTHEISLQTAIDMTTLYRQNRPSNFPICETFEREAIDRLLSTEGCAFLRIYYGMKEGLQADAILVAANLQGEDILPAESDVQMSTTDPLILEDGYRCPQACPPPSSLNP